MKEKAPRNIQLDILRILSAFAVVLLHVTSEYTNSLKVGSVDFNIAVLLNSLTRFAVPMFVMISGELFLNPDKEIPVKKIWVHNILRLAIIYFIWSFGYYIFQSCYFWNFDFYRQGIVRTAVGIVYATTHFWYIGMIIGLYVLTPVLRSWLKHADEKNVRYFVDMFFIFQIARTTLTLLINKSLVYEVSEITRITELTGYLGYYVLGFYLSKYEMKKPVKIFIFVCTPIGLVANFLISVLFSKAAGEYTPGIYDSFGIFTFYLTITLYLLIKKNVKSFNGQEVFVNLSKDTLGIYLAHIMVMQVLQNEIGMRTNLNPIAGIAIYTVLTFIISALIAALIRRIPFIGRYLA